MGPEEVECFAAGLAQLVTELDAQAFVRENWAIAKKIHLLWPVLRETQRMQNPQHGPDQPGGDRDHTLANHIGDISVHDGELYAGIEWFEDGRGVDIQVAIYDTETLTFKRSIPWKPESGQVEVSAVAVDAENGLVWMTDWVNGSYVYRYDLVTGSYAGKLHLQPVPQWQQGIAAFDGSLFITADDGDAEEREVDHLWRVSSDPQVTAAYVGLEMAFDSFRDVGEIEGIAFDTAAGEMLVLANRGKRVVLGMPKGLYPGYDREISEIYVYRVP